MLTVIAGKPRLIFVPFFEEPTHENYREAVFDETLEIWKVPPEVNTSLGVLASGSINWRTGDQPGSFQPANAGVPTGEARAARQCVLQGLRDGVVVKQAAHVQLQGLEQRSTIMVGGF